THCHRRCPNAADLQAFPTRRSSDLFQYGKAGDMVYAGDWDGNGRDSFLVRRGKEYHVKNSLRGGPADVVMLYGRATDEVYIGDWDGNGTDTVGVRRTPATVAAAQEG